jgi:glycyl-tRNA synthetase beta chain
VTPESDRPLLLELGCEELPPAAQPELLRALREALETLLARAELLGPGESRAWRTPRRLALLFSAVRRRGPSRRRLVTGPLLSRAYDSEGRPTAALLGFARAQGLEPEQLGNDGERLVAERLEEGADLATLLERELPAILASLPTARRMVWDDGLPAFPRPIRRLLLLHGTEVLPVCLGPLTACGETPGHRVHHPQPIAIGDARRYPNTLMQGFVFPVDEDALPEARRNLETKLQAAAVALVPEFPSHPEPWTLEEDPDLLDENLGLLEFHGAIAGTFDPVYLELPEDVVRVVLRVKQRAFTLHDGNGDLLPAFVAAVDLESRDPRRLREGLERVVRPRLADALFFFRQDRAVRLADRLPALAEVRLEHGLGTLADRTRRLVELVGRLAPCVGVDESTVRRAAELSQCDLLTALVGEYPELEGTAGGFYARIDGEPEAVARALSEQVLPRRAGDRLPETRAGALLAVTLRTEILTGSFARGIQPSGQSDPMGLRRAASGLLQILLSGILDLDLFALFLEGLRLHGVEEAKSAAISERLYAFSLERLASILEARADLFQAVATVRPTSPADFRDRLDALLSVIEGGGDAAVRLVAANKRIQNILRRTDGRPAPLSAPPDGEPSASRVLEALVVRLESEILEALARRAYRSILERLLETGDPLERFFAEVLVMDPDERRRRHRLALLARLEKIMHAVAALERVQIPGNPL